MKKLDRDLGLVSVIAIAIGSMIGGGIFVLPGLAAAKTGASFWLAYLIAGLFVVPAALSQSEMATAMPKAGGVYVFVDRSLGPLYGTIAGIGTWLAMLFKASFALVGISYYLGMFTSVPYKPVAFGLLVFVTLLNIVGVKKVGKAQVVIVIICMISLGMLIVKGAWNFDNSHFSSYFSKGGYGLLATTGLVFISYAGVTKIASIAEEIINPERNLPLAMILSLVIMMILYSLIALVLVGVIPLKGATAATSLAGNKQAIALLGQVLYGTPGKIALAAIAIVALASMANAGLLAASRYPLAMSRDEMVPSIFKSINERFVTPMVSIVFTAACMAVAIAFLPVVKIAKLASGMQVLLFMAINVSVIVLRSTNPQWYNPRFKTPLYPGVQIIGILGCLVLLVTLGQFVLVGTALLLLVGALWFFYYARHKTRRRGVIQKMRSKSKKEPIASDEDGEDIRDSELVIPLSGNEFSPESLLAIGSALGARKMSVVDLVEIPDQLVLYNALLDETPRMKALKRRISLMSNRLSIDAHVDFIASHDRRHALFEYAKHSQAPWFLVDMGPHQTFYKVRRYLGWLTSHMPCNLAIFQNEGFRITQNVLVLLDGDESDELIIEVSNNLAEMYDARVTLLCVLPESESDEVFASMQVRAAELRELYTVPTVDIRVEKGDLLPIVIEESITHELMVMDFPMQGSSRWYIDPKQHETLLSEVACSVLSIKPGPDKSAALLPKSEPVEYSLHLPDLLDPRTIRMQDAAETREELFASFAQLFAKVSEHPVELFTKALETGVPENTELLGGGVGILHAETDELSKTLFGCVVLNQPLHTKSDEHEEVDIFVLTIGPVSDHDADLRLREELKELLSDEAWLGRLRAAHNTDNIMRLFRSKYSSSPELDS